MDSFIEQLKNELQKMDREQIARFAWLCAVRALPFVGAKGNFNHWEEMYRKRYLYYLFRLLDISYYSILAGAEAAEEDLDVYYEETGIYYHYGDPYKRLNPYPDRNIGYSAASAARSVHEAYQTAANYDKFAGFEEEITNAACCALNAAAYYDTKDDDDDDCNYNGPTSTKMQQILLGDIKNIQKWDKISHNDLSWYKEIWFKFQQALHREGCSYWAHLYNEIFEKSFVLNGKALEKRLSVPSNICEQGAEAVADFLRGNEY